MKITQCIPTSFLSKLTLLFVTALLSQTALASEEAHGDHHGAEHKNFVGVFLGATRDAEGETDSTYGVEFEHKFTGKFGIGVVWEKSPDAHGGDGVSVALASLYLHPMGGWRLGLGAGSEKLHGSHGHTENLVRASVAYDFHIGGFGIAPTFALDSVDGNSIKVFGIAISKGF